MSRSRSSDDEKLLQAVVNTITDDSDKEVTLYIIDARPKINAQTNMGKLMSIKLMQKYLKL